MITLSKEDKEKIRIFSGSSSKELSKKIAEYLEIDLSSNQIVKFADGETFVKSNESVRGCKVFVIQSTSKPVNESLMELLIFIDALRRSSAREITAVIPYYGYARQDRKASPREPITSKLVANLLTVAGATRVITMDLHARQIQGFFDIPVDHMEALPILAKHFIKYGFNPEDTVVVSPDVGGVKRARGLANWLHTPLAIIDKRRAKANVSEVMNIIGDVKGKKAILIDDMIDTAGTICNAAQALIDTRVITMDLHARQIQGFFDIPVDHMEALPILAKHFIKYGFNPEDTVVVSPDVGGVKRARGLANWLHTPLAIIDKRRAKANVSEVMNIIGDVKGKKAILIDDMIDTAGTICNAAQALIDKGATEVYGCATHAVFSGPAIERLKNSAFTEVVVTDSIELPEDKIFNKLRILTASKMFAEIIKRIATNEAISDLFEIPTEN